MDIEKLQLKLREFAKERDWEQFHSPKNLAMALSVEAAELLEIFQWSNSGGLDEIKDAKKKREIEEEVADIFNYLLKICDKLDIDLEKAALDKIEINESKYPVEKVKGSSKKYNR